MKIEQLNVLLELLNEFRYEVDSSDYFQVEETISLVLEIINKKEDEKKFDDDAYVVGALRENFKFTSKINTVAKGTVYTAQKEGKSFMVRWGESGKEKYTERDLYDAINKGEYIIID